MMRTASHMRGNLALYLVGGIAFVITLIAAAPASLLPSLVGNAAQTVSYQNVEGTIWRGKFSNVWVGDIPMGDVDYTVSLFSILILSPRADLRTASGAVRGSGVFAFGIGGNILVTDADFDIDLGPFAQRGILGMPVNGSAQLKASRLELSKTGCEFAQGEIWTDVLEAPAKQYQVEGFPLSGDITCDGADLKFTLSGGKAKGQAELAFLLSPDMAYKIVATAQSSDADLVSALRFFGFEGNDETLTYGTAGVLRGAGS